MCIFGYIVFIIIIYLQICFIQCDGPQEPLYGSAPRKFVLSLQAVTQYYDSNACSNVYELGKGREKGVIGTNDFPLGIVTSNVECGQKVMIQIISGSYTYLIHGYVHDKSVDRSNMDIIRYWNQNDHSTCYKTTGTPPQQKYEVYWRSSHDSCVSGYHSSGIAKIRTQNVLISVYPIENQLDYIQRSSATSINNMNSNMFFTTFHAGYESKNCNFTPIEQNIHAGYCGTSRFDPCPMIKSVKESKNCGDLEYIKISNCHDMQECREIYMWVYIYDFGSMYTSAPNYVSIEAAANLLHSNCYVCRNSSVSDTDLTLFCSTKECQNGSQQSKETKSIISDVTSDNQASGRFCWDNGWYVTEVDKFCGISDKIIYNRNDRRGEFGIILSHFDNHISFCWDGEVWYLSSRDCGVSVYFCPGEHWIVSFDGLCERSSDKLSFSVLMNDVNLPIIVFIASCTDCNIDSSGIDSYDGIYIDGEKQEKEIYINKLLNHRKSFDYADNRLVIQCGMCWNGNRWVCAAECNSWSNLHGTAVLQIKKELRIKREGIVCLLCEKDDNITCGYGTNCDGLHHELADKDEINQNLRDPVMKHCNICEVDGTIECYASTCFSDDTDKNCYISVRNNDWYCGKGLIPYRNDNERLFTETPDLELLNPKFSCYDGREWTRTPMFDCDTMRFVKINDQLNLTVDGNPMNHTLCRINKKWRVSANDNCYVINALYRSQSVEMPLKNESFTCGDISGGEDSTKDTKSLQLVSNISKSNSCVEVPDVTILASEGRCGSKTFHCPIKAKNMSCGDRVKLSFDVPSCDSLESTSISVYAVVYEELDDASNYEIEIQRAAVAYNIDLIYSNVCEQSDKICFSKSECILSYKIKDKMPSDIFNSSKSIKVDVVTDQLLSYKTKNEKNYHFHELTHDSAPAVCSDETISKNFLACKSRHIPCGIVIYSDDESLCGAVKKLSVAIPSASSSMEPIMQYEFMDIWVKVYDIYSTASKKHVTIIPSMSIINLINQECQYLCYGDAGPYCVSAPTCHEGSKSYNNINPADYMVSHIFESNGLLETLSKTLRFFKYTSILQECETPPIIDGILLRGFGENTRSALCPGHITSSFETLGFCGDSSKPCPLLYSKATAQDCGKTGVLSYFIPTCPPEQYCMRLRQRLFFKIFDKTVNSKAELEMPFSALYQQVNVNCAAFCSKSIYGYNKYCSLNERCNAAYTPRYNMLNNEYKIAEAFFETSKPFISHVLSKGSYEIIFNLTLKQELAVLNENELDDLSDEDLNLIILTNQTVSEESQRTTETPVRNRQIATTTTTTTTTTIERTYALPLRDTPIIIAQEQYEPKPPSSNTKSVSAGFTIVGVVALGGFIGLFMKYVSDRRKKHETCEGIEEEVEEDETPIGSIISIFD